MFVSTIYIHYTSFLIKKDIMKDWFDCGFVYLPRIELSGWYGRYGRYGSFSSCFEICSCIRKYIHMFDCQSECVGLVSDKVMGQTGWTICVGFLRFLLLIPCHLNEQNVEYLSVFIHTGLTTKEMASETGFQNLNCLFLCIHGSLQLLT